MIRRDQAFYRSNTVRIACIIAGAFLAAVLSPWAPAGWHNTASLTWLHHLLPWPVLSGGFLLYTLLLVWGSIGASVFADFLGLFMYLCGFIALCWTAGDDGRPINGFALAALFLACVLHLAAGRLALIQRETL